MNVLCWVSSASNGGALDVVDVLRYLCHTSARAAKYVCADLHVLLRVVAACYLLVGRYSDDFTPL